MFTTIDEQRAFGDRLMVGVLWVMAVIITVVALLSDGSWLGFGLASAGTAAAATAAWRVGPGSASSRLTVAVATMAQVSLLVACQSGHPWQIDMHMAYFAALAALVIYCDWRVILAGAAIVAVHHLTLSFILPAAVFPGGGALGRVVVHAVILIAEAVTLMWVAHSIVNMFKTSGEAVVRAEEALRLAEWANSSADEARAAEARAGAEQAALQAQVEAERALGGRGAG